MKRIIAIACIIILIFPYILTLITAFMGNANSGKYFMASLVSTAILPVLMWVILQTAKHYKKKGEQLRNEINSNEK